MKELYKQARTPNKNKILTPCGTPIMELLNRNIIPENLKGLPKEFLLDIEELTTTPTRAYSIKKKILTRLRTDYYNKQSSMLI